VQGLHPACRSVRMFGGRSEEASGAGRNEVGERRGRPRPMTLAEDD